MGEAAIAQHRPTIRQKALVNALILGKAETVTEAAEIAGLNRSHASRSLHHNATVARELEIVQRRRLDKARGLDALVERTVNRPELLENVEARDQLLIGMQAMKLRHELGDIVENGDGDAFITWKREHLRRGYSRLRRMETLGVGPLGWRKRDESQLDSEHNHDVIEVTATSVET